MKLFKKYDFKQWMSTEKFEAGVMFSFGKMLDIRDIETITINEMGLQVHENNKVIHQTGNFIRIELPFGRFRRYLCPYEFKVKAGKCRPTWMLKWRKKLDGTKSFTKVFVWLPEDRP